LLTLQRYTSQILSIRFVSKGQILVSRGRDGTVSLWDVETGQCLTTLQDDTNQIQDVALSPDGEVLATTSGEETIQLWDGKTGECLLTLYGHTERVQCIAIASLPPFLRAGLFHSQKDVYCQVKH
jgi:WD40 repeat protein